jgi:hypothetical protein
MSKKAQNNPGDQDAGATEWRHEWVGDLRYFHASEEELSDFMAGGDLSRRAASHLHLCVTCRERLAFEIEGAVLEQRHGSSELDTFLSFLNHKEAVVRASAARAVVSLAERAPAAINQLSVLRYDADPTVRSDVAVASTTLDRLQEPAAAKITGIAEWRVRHDEERRRAAEHALRVNAAVDVQERAVGFANRRRFLWSTTWPDGGDLVICLEVVGNDRVLSLNTTREDLNGKLVQCALAGTDTRPLEMWLVLHRDPLNDGNFRASTRLDAGAPLPGKHRPEPSSTPAIPLPADLLSQAVRQACTEEDRVAFRSWIEANKGGQLPGDTHN